MPLRVTLIDDDELTTRGMMAMLREHDETIELVTMSDRLTEPIDVALYDHALSHPGGRPTLTHLLSNTRIRKVALFTWNYQPWAAAQLIDQGAAAYLPKSLTGAELVRALHAVHAGRVRITSRANSAGAPTGTRAGSGEVLTVREAEVLSLICRGLSNAEIAGTLNLSINSVKSYIRSCYRKIDVESRTKAVVWGLGRGLGERVGATHSSARSSSEELAARELGPGGTSAT